MEPARLFAILDHLIDVWCARRALRPLKVLLSGYPPAPHLSGEWATLYAAIRNLKGLAPELLIGDERAAIAEAHALIYALLKASPAGIGIVEAAG